MTRSLTHTNLPDALHARLSAAAKHHRRSLNSGAIVCLEAGLAQVPAGLEERLAAIRALRQTLPAGNFTAEESAAYRSEGRP